MMEQDFLNTYIENMAKKMGDLLKSEILLSTQLEMARKLIENLTKENNDLKNKLEKRSKKEVNTSDTF